MIRIIINGEQIKSTKPIEVIFAVHVITGGLHEIAPRKKVQAIADFTWDACQRCIGTIMFNHTIIHKKDVKKIIL